MKTDVAALILAAGLGTRMRTHLPKVLHRCGDLPLAAHVVRLALERRCHPVVVVVSPGAEPVRDALRELFPEAPFVFAVQEKRLGTGDAARVGLKALDRFQGRVLILYGDVPLLRAATVARLEKAARRAPLALLTAIPTDPTGYGRVVRENATVARIVEHRDASPEELAIREVNAGVYVTRADFLRRALKGLSRNNAQGELYLTDIVPLAAKAGGAVPVKLEDWSEVQGVNTRAELVLAEQILRQRLVAEHQKRGVTFRDPLGCVLGAEVELGPDVEIGMGVQLRGRVKVGRAARIEGPTWVRDSVIGPEAEIAAFCHIDGAIVARGARIGPFARLRPGAEIAADAHVGNFVELKQARLGKGAKANHLAYLGDAEIGAGSNIGAGTITCNYDGTNKHRTDIGQGVFVGSNSTLVAPLKIANGAYVAAGSTITKDVPRDALAFGRARQVSREGYAVVLRRRIRGSKERS
jgi:bifunctional UDP-N-acetylglucosamine pyrophosphorylase/glucosamine-1-phosphate N-acetyltransferase